jgi:hypothetical protein
MVKLGLLDTLNEGFPLRLGELQDRAIGIPGVADRDAAVGSGRYLDAQRCQRVSPPNQRQIAASFVVFSGSLKLKLFEFE